VGATSRAIALYQPHASRVQARFLDHMGGNGHAHLDYPWCLSWGKRMMDVVLAVSCLLLGAPLLLLAAAAVVLDSPGPVFFLQWRTGYGGQRFRIFKFRTMLMDAELQKESLRPLSHHGPDSPDFKIRNDPRVTRVGRILRRLSIDEVPNLINVVRGDMSLVGPRPTSFTIDRYEDWHLDRLAVLPGVTGLWQISGRSEIGFDERVRLDCQYIEHQSFWLDVRILGATPLRVLGGRGAC
jgi:lipopolysaccharide/colanic/teichoic acid biosynthesis glycosyltransferase